ncbi:hypothetical protein MJD09_09475 [bacterium]|nr:hypothetical protein [bacterium]
MTIHKHNPAAAMLDKIESLRTSGDVQRAASEINKIIKTQSTHCPTLVEAIKIYLLNDAAPQASKLYSLVRHLPEASDFWRMEYLLRLKLSSKNLPVPEIEQLDKEDCALWCHEFWSTGQDPLYAFTLTNYAATCFDGTVTYDFTGECSSCRSEYHTHVYMTFLIHREYICPICFARQLLDHEMIREFMSHQLSATANEKIEDLDQTLRRIQFELDLDAERSEGFPMLCNYLGQDYVFALNEFLVGRMCRESQTT